MLHRPARTAVSVLGISIGVLLIVFTIGLTNGSMRERAKREGNVGAQIMFRASGTMGLSGSDAFRVPVIMTEDLAKIEGVKSAVAIGENTVPTTDNNQGSRSIDGVNFDEYAQMAGLLIIEGRAIGASGDEAVIDTGWQNQRSAKIGDTIKMYQRDFKIVGTYEPAAGGRVKIPLATMQEQLGGENRCTAILVSVKDGYTPEAVAGKIHDAFPDNRIILTKDLPELYMQAVPALGVFLNVVVGVAAAISGLVILLTMYTTVTERTRQIGILKSLGMTNAKIGWVIVQEAMLISFFGILTGVVLTVVLRFLLTKITTVEVQLDPLVVASTLVIGLIGGALGALYPALHAARMDAVEALSYE